MYYQAAVCHITNETMTVESGDLRLLIHFHLQPVRQNAKHKDDRKADLWTTLENLICITFDCTVDRVSKRGSILHFLT